MPNTLSNTTFEYGSHVDAVLMFALLDTSPGCIFHIYMEFHNPLTFQQSLALDEMDVPIPVGTELTEIFEADKALIESLSLLTFVKKIHLAETPFTFVDDSSAFPVEEEEDFYLVQQLADYLVQQLAEEAMEMSTQLFPQPDEDRSEVIPDSWDPGSTITVEDSFDSGDFSSSDD